MNLKMFLPFPLCLGLMKDIYPFLLNLHPTLPHPLVCCSAAEVQGSFFIHRPVYTLKGGGAGEGSNGASLRKVTPFPLVLNR